MIGQWVGKKELTVEAVEIMKGTEWQIKIYMQMINSKIKAWMVSA